MTQKELAEQWKQGVQIMYRNQTKEVRIGDVVIGGDHPIAIQSMTNTRTEDVEATVEQILRLEKAGCEIIRCTVPTMEAAKAIKEIKKQIHIPLVADIHFDYKMAIAAIENGADKIRINPGNIGAKERVQAVVDKAKEYNVPIRVGVNSGSLEKHLLEKYGGVTAEGIVESALDKVHLIESMGYDNLVVSIKSSDVLMCVKAHELIAKECPYPLHVGITESGTVYSGNVKSSVGLGIILHEGIGNTIRVSLTGDPVEEIRTAKLILKTLGLRKGGIEVVSCPTCGRTRIDLIKLANQVEEMVADIPLDIKVAVMGCVVNGPGEAKEADIGIAGGIGEGLLIKKGEIIKKVKEEESKPLNGNDVILPRSSYKEPSNGAITIVNVLVGVVIGAALIWFLVMPSRYKGITEDYNRSLAEYSEQLSSGNVELNSMESELKTVKAEKESLEQQLSELNGTGGGNKLLISVIESANAYIANKRTEAAEKLIDVDVSALPSDSAKTLYNTISTAVMAQAANEFYSKAQTSYYKSDYATAVDDYVKAFKCDATKVDAAYYAAKCYVALSQTDNAKKYYQYIVNDFKTSGYYKEANDYVTSH